MWGFCEKGHKQNVGEDHLYDMCRRDNCIRCNLYQKEGGCQICPKRGPALSDVLREVQMASHTPPPPSVYFDRSKARGKKRCTRAKRYGTQVVECIVDHRGTRGSVWTGKRGSRLTVSYKTTILQKGLRGNRKATRSHRRAHSL
jgi:hypothetical protein